MKIKDCPFCGHNSGKNFGYYNSPGFENEHAYYCISCAARGPYLSSFLIHPDAGLEEKLITEWNKRVITVEVKNDHR